MRLSLILLALLSILSVGAAHPTEASGQVVHIVDGDTFDVEIEQADRPLEDTIRVRLADIDCPETRGCGAGQAGGGATMTAAEEATIKAALRADRAKLDKHQQRLANFAKRMGKWWWDQSSTGAAYPIINTLSRTAEYSIKINKPLLRDA